MVRHWLVLWLFGNSLAMDFSCAPCSLSPRAFTKVSLVQGTHVMVPMKLMVIIVFQPGSFP